MNQPYLPVGAGRPRLSRETGVVMLVRLSLRRAAVATVTAAAALCLAACGGSDPSAADLCDNQLVDWQEEVGELTSWTSSMLIDDGLDAYDTLSADVIDTGKRTLEQVQDQRLKAALSGLLDELIALGDVASKGPGSPELVVAQSEVLEDQVVVASRCVELVEKTS